MTASRRRPTSRFQPGMAAMYACTGASPSALAICGLPPERSFGFAAARPSCLSAVFARGAAFLLRGDFLDVLLGIVHTPEPRHRRGRGARAVIFPPVALLARRPFEPGASIRRVLVMKV